MKLFATSFPNAYKDALIESIKEAAAPEEEDGNQLPPIPIPSHALKKGTITKKCAFGGNWKPNYFIALNQADNYRIDYYDKEDGVLKGSINGCGYYVNVTEEGVQLEPGNDSRRTYFHKFENSNEKEEWEEIFSIACRKADSPKNDDVILAKAFAGAYKSLRWNYGE